MNCRVLVKIVVLVEDLKNSYEDIQPNGLRDESPLKEILKRYKK